MEEESVTINKEKDDSVELDNRGYLYNLLAGTFDAADTRTILDGYGPVIYALDHETIDDTANFLKRLWKASFWSEDECIIFQTMILGADELSGFNQVFSRHTMYKNLISQEESIQITRLPPSQLSNSNDNNNILEMIPAVKLLRPSTPVPRCKLLNEERPEDRYDLYADPDPIEDLEMLDFLQVGKEFGGITFIQKEEIHFNAPYQINTIFNLLRAFKVDFVCEVTVFMGAKGEKDSWAKDFIAVPGVWINFAEKLLPHNLHFFGLKILVRSENPGKTSIQIMGIKLESLERNSLLETLMNKEIDPYDHGFRRYF